MSQRADQLTQRAMQASLQAQMAVVQFNSQVVPLLQGMTAALKVLSNFPEAQNKLMMNTLGLVNIESINLTPGDSAGTFIFGTDGFFAEQGQISALSTGRGSLQKMRQAVSYLKNEAERRNQMILLEYEHLRCTYKNMCLNLPGSGSHGGSMAFTPADATELNTDLKNLAALEKEFASGRSGTFWVSLVALGVAVSTGIGLWMTLPQDARPSWMNSPGRYDSDRYYNSPPPAYRNNPPSYRGYGRGGPA